jgi:hypothetical protein
MKNIIYLGAIAGLILGSCATESDYKAMSDDMCNCMTKASAGIPADLQAAIVEGGKSGAGIEKVMTDYVSKDPSKGMAAATEFQNAATGYEKCGTDIAKKYDQKRTTDSEQDVMKKLIKYMKENKSCAFVSAMVDEGLKQQ